MMRKEQDSYPQAQPPPQHPPPVGISAGSEPKDAESLCEAKDENCFSISSLPQSVQFTSSSVLITNVSNLLLQHLHSYSKTGI